jgi:hypothetical protein
VERENLRKGKFTRDTERERERERERQRMQGVNGGVNVKERIWFYFSRPFLLGVSAGCFAEALVCCREAVGKEKIHYIHFCVCNIVMYLLFGFSKKKKNCLNVL